MPKYYFNLHRSNSSPLPDEVGLELESDIQAKLKALQSLPELLAETVSDELENVEVKIQVVQETGETLQIITAKIELADGVEPTIANLRA